MVKITVVDAKDSVVAPWGILCQEEKVFFKSVSTYYDYKDYWVATSTSFNRAVTLTGLS